MFFHSPTFIIMFRMKKGKLYGFKDSQFEADVDYRLYQRSESTEWSGEVTLPGNLKINDNDIFEIELEDGCKCLCKLRKKVNKAVSGIPPRFIYHATSLS